MNNLAIAFILGTASLALTSWQAVQINDARLLTNAIHEKLGIGHAGLRELQQTLGDTRRQTRQLEAQTAALKPSPPTISTGDLPATDPQPDELIWDNGHAWIWLEKKLLLSLGFESIRQKSHDSMSDPRMQLTPEAERLLAEFRQDPDGSAKRLGDEEAAALDRDPAIRFVNWAVDRPPELVGQITNFIWYLQDSWQQEATTLPAFEVNRSVSDLLGLTPGQFNAVRQTVNEFLQQARDLERQHLVVLPVSVTPPHAPQDNTEHSHRTVGSNDDDEDRLYDQRIQLRITPYAEEGRTLQEGLTADLRAILGSERAGYWLKLAESSLNNAAGGLGQRDHGLILSFEGKKYSIQESTGGKVNRHSASRGIPALEIWWRPFIRRTADGFELIQ